MAIAPQPGSIAQPAPAPGRHLPKSITAPRWLVGLVVPVALLVLWQWLVSREVYTRSQLPAPGRSTRAAVRPGSSGESHSAPADLSSALPALGW